MLVFGSLSYSALALIEHEILGNDGSGNEVRGLGKWGRILNAPRQPRLIAIPRKRATYRSPGSGGTACPAARLLPTPFLSWRDSRADTHSWSLCSRVPAITQ